MYLGKNKELFTKETFSVPGKKTKDRFCPQGSHGLIGETRVQISYIGEK